MARYSCGRQVELSSKVTVVSKNGDTCTMLTVGETFSSAGIVLIIQGDAFLRFEKKPDKMVDRIKLM